jgi:hypothetical protein
MHSKFPIGTCSTSNPSAMHVIEIGFKRKRERNSVKRGRRQEDGFLAFTLLEVVTRG